MSSLLTGLGSIRGGSAATGQELMNDITVQNGPEDTVTDLSFSPQQELLAAASWDSKVRIYEISPTGQTQGRALYQHDGPVFSSQWSKDGTKVVSGGADKQVKLFDLQSQQATQIGAHDAPVRSVRYVECGPTNMPVVVSGSWDKTLRYWDMRSPQPILTLTLPERVYAMDTSGKLLVAACAEKHISVIDLNNPQQVFKQVQSPLKWQTRSICCYPSGDGYAIGSIEGRCSIYFIDENKHSKFGFSFRCHRKTQNNVNNVYAVNSIAFHPIYGTFSTAGSDGIFCFWDKDAKQKLKVFPQLPGPVTATAFNRTGSIFAYAFGYDWAQGYMGNKPDFPTQIKLHPTNDEEIKQKKK